jgi:hypothetical protein
LQVPFLATLEAARAAVGAIVALRSGEVTIKSLQEYHGITSVKRPQKAAAPPVLRGH